MNKFLDKLAPRERYLAIATMALLAVFLVLFLTLRAVQYVEELDRTTVRLEDELVRDVELAARGVSVDRAYAQVSSQHSSEWTPAEIHDRLRQEIQRLSLEDPDAPNSGFLVEIPIMRQGSLKDSGQGYREYSLSLKPSPTDVYSIFMFLIRLQSSQQTLRIDGVELARSPDAELVSATINVTRIVVEGVKGEDGAAPGEPVDVVAQWDGAAMEPWRGTGFEMALAMPADPNVPEAAPEQHVVATAIAPNARLEYPHELEPGTTYRLAVDVTASGPATFQVIEESTGKPFEGEKELHADGMPYRYEVVFTVPRSELGKMKIHAPSFLVAAPDVRLEVDNLVLTKVEGQ